MHHTKEELQVMMVLQCDLQPQPHSILDQHKYHARYYILNFGLEAHTDKNDKLSCWYCYPHLQLHLQIYILCISNFHLYEIRYVNGKEFIGDAYISILK